MAILLLHEGRTVTDVHHLTGAARSTIGRWLRWYRDEGIDALEALPAGRAPVLPIAKMVTLLVLLMQFFSARFLVISAAVGVPNYWLSKSIG
ncbi:hypothetical protein BHR42_21505 [Aeromonas salmonicida subsp. salmonicida]|nr:hypothetical protein BHR42_21505 [Aeromonas salmonicida subsp. salmonicida]